MEWLKSVSPKTALLIVVLYAVAIVAAVIIGIIQGKRDRKGKV